MPVLNYFLSGLLPVFFCVFCFTKHFIPRVARSDKSCGEDTADVRRDTSAGRVSTSDSDFDD